MFSLGQMFSSHVVFFRVQMSLIKVDWLSVGKHQDLMMYGSAWLQLGKSKKKTQKGANGTDILLVLHFRIGCDLFHTHRSTSVVICFALEIFHVHVI